MNYIGNDIFEENGKYYKLKITTKYETKNGETFLAGYEKTFEEITPTPFLNVEN